MNVYKISWVSQGQPQSLIGVAESPQVLSSFVKSIDENNNISEVSELYKDVQVFPSEHKAAEPKREPSRFTPAVDDAPVRSVGAKKK